MVELGMNPDQRRGGQFGSLLQQADSQGLIAAAATAPAAAQPRLYQQAALKALEEGNIDGARQIANEHLDASLKASVLQTIDLQVMARTATAEKIDEIRQTVGRLKTEDERIKTLLQLAGSAGKQNEKLARDLLEDARIIVARRPSTYPQFDTQLRVARAFSSLGRGEGDRSTRAGYHATQRSASSGCTSQRIRTEHFQGRRTADPGGQVS
jgi:hypothetical protein